MPPKMDSLMPSLDGEETTWFNSPPVTLDELKGHTTIIHFWSISCGICKESLPDLYKLMDAYAPKGLKIVSVHMPRQESDTNIEAVKECMSEYEIKQPVVVDNMHAITDKFENKYVPAYYVFDSDLKMRNFAAGEKALKMTEPVLERLMGKQEAKA